MDKLFKFCTTQGGKPPWKQRISKGACPLDKVINQLIKEL